MWRSVFLTFILLPCLGLKNGFRPVIRLVDPGDAVGLLPLDRHGQLGPPAAALAGGGGSGDGIDPVQVLRDPRGLFPDVLWGWGGTVLREALRSGDPLLPGTDCVGSGPHPRPGVSNLVWVDPEGILHLLHSLLSVRVDLYSTIWHLFAWLGELPAEGLPPVMEIPHKAFMSRRSICAIPQVEHVAHLGGIYLPDCQKIPW